MDSKFEKVFSQLWKDMSLYIIDEANHVLKGLEKVINQENLFNLSQFLLIFCIGIYICIGFKQFLYFTNGNLYQVNGYWKENNKPIIEMIVVLVLLLFPNQVLYLTFNYWNTFFDEKEIFQQLQKASIEIHGDTGIKSSLILMSSSITTLFIVLNQVLEVLALILILFLSPFVLIGRLYRPDLFHTFAKWLFQAILIPISQTFFMFISFQTTAPLMIEKQFSPTMQWLFIVTLILLSFKVSTQMSAMLFVSEHHKRTFLYRKGVYSNE